MEGLLEALEHDLENGELQLNGTRYMLIRPETLAELFNVCGSRAERAFYAAGITGGTLSARKLWEQTRDARQTVNRMLDMGGFLGWGRMEATSIDFEKKRLVVEVRNSPLAWQSGAGCKLLEGVLAGVGSVVFGAQATADEVCCRGAGHDRCCFVIAVQSEGESL